MNIESLESLNKIRQDNIKRDLEFRIERINDYLKLAAARSESHIRVNSAFLNKKIKNELIKRGYKVVYKSNIPRLPYYEISWEYKDDKNDY